MRRLNVNFILGIYLGIIVWWFSLYISGTKDIAVINGFSAVWTVITIVISFYAIIHIYKIRTLITNNRFIVSILFIALGLLLWCLGNFIWVIYNIVFHVSLPFPSYADVLFLGCLPFLLIGTYDFFNAEINNIYNINLHIANRAVMAVLCAAGVLSIAFYAKYDLILLRFVINMLFVSFDIMILSLVLSPWILVVLTNKRFRYGVGNLVLLIGTVCLFISDVGFFYGTSNNTYSNGGIVDLFYLSFTFMLGIGLLFIINECYPPFTNDYAGFGANYLIKISYFRQISLNCAMRVLAVVSVNPSLMLIPYIPVLFVT